MQADLNFIELNKNELSIEVKIGVNSLLEDLKVIEDVFDQLAFMFDHLLRQLTLKQAIV